MDKVESYKKLIPQLKSLIGNETNLIANMANISSALHQNGNFLWTGFYFAENQELVLGPFQGPIACTRIGFGKGVCGTAWELKKTIIVDNVHEFPGHIACSEKSNSEIVIPMFDGDKLIFLLDIDSENYAFFDEIDKKHLEEICDMILQQIKK